MWTEWVGRNRNLLRGTAVVVPLTVSGMLYFLTGVVGVVGVAATGDRTSGILAGLASAAGFDFFLTVPYFSLKIADPEDIELAVLLLLVGLAVNELALWGGRQRARASEREGFIRGVLESSDLVAAGRPGMETVETVAGHIWHSLGAERVTYAEGARPRTRRSCSATARLPTDRFTAVPVTQSGRTLGHFQVTMATRLVRPSTERLRIAVLLADQVARRRAHGGTVRGSV